MMHSSDSELIFNRLGGLCLFSYVHWLIKTRRLKKMLKVCSPHEYWHDGSACSLPPRPPPLRFVSHAFHVTTKPPTGNETWGFASGARIGFDLTSMCQKPRCWWGIWLAPCKSRRQYQSARQIRESTERQESGSQRSHYWERDLSRVGMRKWRAEKCVCRCLARRERVSSTDFRRANEGQTQQWRLCCKWDDFWAAGVLGPICEMLLVV